MKDVNFSFANLKNANLTRSKLKSAVFEGANLSNIYFLGAYTEVLFPSFSQPTIPSVK